MIRFSCPCGKSLSARDEYAGETTRCPDCDHELTIPGGEGVQAGPVARDSGDEGVRRSRRGRDDASDERPAAPKTSGMAITSLILGIVALIPCSVFTGLPAIILGGICLGAIGRSRGRIKGKGLAITGIILGGLSILLLPVVAIGLLSLAQAKVREAADRIGHANNLKQIILALHSLNDVNGMMPAAAICDKNGKRLLSWRVAVLPYIGQDALFHQFKLDEPWDGPNNSKLIPLMPKTYALPNDPAAATGSTYYRVFVGNGAAFDWCKGVPLSDFKDGPSNTILVVEATTAVPWTKPDELDFDPKGPAPQIGGHYQAGAVVGMADGSVHLISPTVSPQTLKAAITRNAGDVLGPDW
jgi:hypothetical protein